MKNTNNFTTHYNVTQAVFFLILPGETRANHSLAVRFYQLIKKIWQFFTQVVTKNG